MCSVVALMIVDMGYSASDSLVYHSIASDSLVYHSTVYTGYSAIFNH